MLASLPGTKFWDVLPDVFATFSWSDVIDIALSAFFVYIIIIFIKQTRTYFVFTTLGALAVVSYVAKLFDFSLTRQLFQPILTFFLVIFVIVFQREIRRFFRWFSSGRANLGHRVITLTSEISATIVKAVQEMARLKMGSLIVVTGEYPLDDVVDGGFVLDGKISSPLILSIFDHTTPGHDGAMIIENKRIKKFGVHLPLAEDFKGFATMGTRHRAGIGISERTDCLAIIVSEERGTISVAEGGKLTVLQTAGQLDDIIKRFIKENHPHENATPKLWQYFIFNNLFSKIVAVGISILLWLVLVGQSSIVNKDFVVPIKFRHIPSGYVVDKVTPSSITISLSGADHDISLVRPEDVGVQLEIPNAQEGLNEFVIDKDNVKYPQYLNLAKASSDKIKITLVKIPQNEDQATTTTTIPVE